jgi:hypothetical protein
MIDTFDSALILLIRFYLMARVYRILPKGKKIATIAGRTLICESE